MFYSNARAAPIADPQSTLLGIALLVLLSTACDPQVSLQGRLTDSTGQPLKVGEIRVECPDLCVFAVVHNDRGEFVGSKLGRGCKADCQLRARSVGFRELAASASTYCTHESGPLCTEFMGNLVLERGA